VQTEDYARADELFRHDYAYFSSVSTGWLKHAAEYAAKMTTELGLDNKSLVMEVASNDGYLLRNFVAAGIPCLGIEPTISTAEAAESLGIPVLKEFFGEQLGLRLAGEGSKADLIAGNNVYAHVPDINDFTKGLAAVLKPEGVITLEFPHLLRLIQENQFDTVYHEHFSYLSLYSVSRIFEAAGLRIWNVEKLPTHGGSLRVYGCLKNSKRTTQLAVELLLAEEQSANLQILDGYVGFQAKADTVKDNFVAFLIDAKKKGLKVAAYGAAAKGNTLMNYAGIRPDLMPYVCDAAHSKQNKFMPGSHIPILPPSILDERAPDLIVILPWNIAAEVVCQLASHRQRGAKFYAAIPTLRQIV
jgi:SAM-dependent methyltransferase